MAYLALSTANLPDPVIDPAQGASPEDYFGAVTYTGNGSTSGNAITGLGFSPEMVWIKVRNEGYNHYLVDIVRGTSGSGWNVLQPNLTSADATGTGVGEAFVSLDSDGFTVAQGSGNWYGTNQSGKNYVAWNWKANGSGVSNTDGSITSTVSANPDAGFSIVGYTGTQSAATVGHGLSSAPEMIITKCRSIANGWPVYHKDIPNANQYMIRLNDTQTYTTAGQSSIWWNNTFPTSTVFSLGANDESNKSGGTHIAYCFHSVEGFSSFGKYVGNGSTDGPFVYTGFRPAFVLFKKINVTTASWAIRDNTRYTYNPTRNTLYADKSDAEYTGTAHDIDFLSNGFKPRTTDGLFNSSGATYIYMAFAENPFKFSTAS